MTQPGQLEMLEMRADDLEHVITQLKESRGEMLRLRRSAAKHNQALLDERLHANARTMMTLMASLATVRVELRRYRALRPEHRPSSRVASGN